MGHTLPDVSPYVSLRLLTSRRKPLRFLTLLTSQRKQSRQQQPRQKKNNEKKKTISTEPNHHTNHTLPDVSPYVSLRLLTSQRKPLRFLTLLTSRRKHSNQQQPRQKKKKKTKKKS